MKELLSGYKLYDHKHPLRWSVDNHEMIGKMALQSTEDCAITATELIDIIHIPDAGGMIIVFSLKDDNYALNFDALCHNIIEGTRQCSERDGTKKVGLLFNKWKRMLKGQRGLDSIEIQGLIGELLSMKISLIPEYGEVQTINGWMNSLWGDQDFILGNKWFEIKTAIVGSKTITISSLDQLDRDDEGFLLLVFLRRVSESSGKKITLNTAYNDMIESLTDETATEVFKDAMSGEGYRPNDPVYDAKDIFELAGMKSYSVREGFPRIRRTELKIPGISDARYEILIDMLHDYEVL